MNSAANTETLADIVNELRRGDTHGAHRVYTIPRRNIREVTEWKLVPEKEIKDEVWDEIGEANEENGE